MPCFKSVVLPGRKIQFPSLSDYNLPCQGLDISKRKKVAFAPPLIQSGSSEDEVVSGVSGSASKILLESAYSAMDHH